MCDDFAMVKCSVDLCWCNKVGCVMCNQVDLRNYPEYEEQENMLFRKTGYSGKQVILDVYWVTGYYICF